MEGKREGGMVRESEGGMEGTREEGDATHSLSDC